MEQNEEKNIAQKIDKPWRSWLDFIGEKYREPSTEEKNHLYFIKEDFNEDQLMAAIHWSVNKFIMYDNSGEPEKCSIQQAWENLYSQTQEIEIIDKNLDSHKENVSQ